ncbi:MAG: hypothetical protein ACTSO7_10020 [Candidatus Heimdallarchaeota archaeon]
MVDNNDEEKVRGWEFISAIILIFILISLCFISWISLAEGQIGYFHDEINIWGRIIYYHIYYDETLIVDQITFSEYGYPAIVPLFTTCLVLLTIPAIFLFPILVDIPILQDGKCFIHRFFRVLFGTGGVCGIIAYNKFGQFMNNIYGVLGFYETRTSFNYAYVVFSFAIFLGFLSAVLPIRVVKSKKHKDEKKIPTPKMKEVILPKIGSTELSVQEKLEKIESLIFGKKNVSLSWVEIVTLVPKEEIIEIVTTNLGFVVIDDSILAPKEAEKQAKRNRT